MHIRPALTKEESIGWETKSLSIDQFGDLTRLRLRLLP